MTIWPQISSFSDHFFSVRALSNEALSNSGLVGHFRLQFCYQYNTRDFVRWPLSSSVRLWYWRKKLKLSWVKNLKTIIWMWSLLPSCLVHQSMVSVGSPSLSPVNLWHPGYHSIYNFTVFMSLNGYNFQGFTIVLSQDTPYKFVEKQSEEKT